MAREQATILVVDDNPGVLETITATIEALGHTIVATSDPREARRLIEERRFDVVVTDVVMRHMGGMEFVKITRRAQPQAEIVVVTAWPTHEVAAAATKLGACAFLPKPFRTEHLNEVVQQAVHRARARRQASEP